MHLNEIQPGHLAQHFWIFDIDGIGDDFREQVDAHQYEGEPDALLKICAEWLLHAQTEYGPLLFDGGLRLFRAIGTNAPEEVRLKPLGFHENLCWTAYPEAATTRYTGGETFSTQLLIEAVAPEHAVDWLNTILLNVYATNEREVRLTATGSIRVVEVRQIGR